MRFRNPIKLTVVCSMLGMATLGCFGGEPSPAIPSPSGEYVAFGAPSGPEAGDDRFCVVLHVTDRAGREVTYQTHASDNMKWALAWAGERTLVLHSSDMGTTAYDIHDGTITMHEPTAAEQQAADDAYARTYGYPPRVASPPAGGGR